MFVTKQNVRQKNVVFERLFLTVQVQFFTVVEDLPIQISCTIVATGHPDSFQDKSYVKFPNFPHTIVCNMKQILCKQTPLPLDILPGLRPAPACFYFFLSLPAQRVTLLTTCGTMPRHAPRSSPLSSATDKSTSHAKSIHLPLELEPELELEPRSVGCGCGGTLTPGTWLQQGRSNGKDKVSVV